MKRSKKIDMRIKENTEKNFGRSVAKSDHIGGVRPNRNGEYPTQTKVSNFDLKIIVDQNVLRFQVSMKNSFSVAFCQSVEQLKHDFLRVSGSFIHL